MDHQQNPSDNSTFHALYGVAVTRHPYALKTTMNRHQKRVPSREDMQDHPNITPI